MQKLLLRIAEAAELASLGRSKAYELVATGEWPSVRIGRAVRVPRDGLIDWVERQRDMTEGAGDDHRPLG